MADGGGSGSADSYIGSLISLTSKSEIRYEGLLYAVDTENSNIALQNVRSFGTEGRKKDGPQIAANDKVYEFIIFRVTDIKDLHVKMSPPPPIHNDPAIISLQAQTSQSASAPPYVPPVADPIRHYSTYKASSVPYYHPPSSNVALWAPPPPPQVPGGNMPLYWQGFYRPPDQHLLMEPPPASAASSTLAQVLSTPITRATQESAASLGQDRTSLYPAIASTSTFSPPSHTMNSPEVRLRSSMVPAMEPVHSTLSGPAASLPVSSSSLSTPNAVSGGHLHEGSGAVGQPSKVDEAKVQGNQDSHNVDPSEGAFRLSSSSSASTTRKGSFTPAGKGPMVYKRVYKQVQPAKEPLNSGHRVPASNLQPPSGQPLLPLPVSAPQHKPLLQVREGYLRTPPMRRGGSRGGGMGGSSRSGQSRSNLLEEFDFIAMNEKFKKEEVWGELLKVESKGTVSQENGTTQVVDYGAETSENGSIFDGTSSDLLKRPMYVKDDFFDSLSCDALEREHGRQDRVKFSEQRKIDVETFGTYHVRSYRGGGGYRGRRGGGRGRRSAGGRSLEQGYGYYNANRGNGRAGAAG